MKKSTKVKKGIIIHRNGKPLIEAVESGILMFEQTPLTKDLQPGEVRFPPSEMPEGLTEINGLKIVADPFLEPGCMIIFCIDKTKRNGYKSKNGGLPA